MYCSAFEGSWSFECVISVIFKHIHVFLIIKTLGKKQKKNPKTSRVNFKHVYCKDDQNLRWDGAGIADQLL